MSWIFTKSPITFSKEKAGSIVNQMIRRYNQVDLKESGELVVRILSSLRSFFSSIRRSSLTEDMKVSTLEGPSSEKMNKFFQAVTDDLQHAYNQQNSIDAVVVENHNLIDTQQNLISNSLKIANDKLAELETVTSRAADSALVVFEDNFDTLQKTDMATPTTLPRADVDISYGVVRLKNDGIALDSNAVAEFKAVAQFDGVTLGTGREVGNMYSDGKLYGDPRELGENGIRYGRNAITDLFTLSSGGTLPPGPGGDPSDPGDDPVITPLPDPLDPRPGGGGSGGGTIDPGGKVTLPEDDPIVIIDLPPDDSGVPGDTPGGSQPPYTPDPLDDPSRGKAPLPETNPEPPDDVTPPYTPDPIIITPGSDPRKAGRTERSDGTDNVSPSDAQNEKRQDFSLFKRSNS